MKQLIKLLFFISYVFQITHELKGNNFEASISILITTVLNTNGPIVEIGISDFNTQLLHTLCKLSKRYICSIETDKDWIDNFNNLKTDWHLLIHTPQLEYVDFSGVQWSIAIIDNDQLPETSYRAVIIEKLRTNTDILIILNVKNNYSPNSNDIISTFKYKYSEKKDGKQAIVISDKIDVNTFFTKNNAPSTRVHAYRSQVAQDAFLNEYFFKNKKNGVFVDIGAHDGISLSNTYFFEKELGWTGICFEPLKKPYKKLKQCRNAACINACAAQEDGVVDFVQVTGPLEMFSGMLSTYSKEHFETLEQYLKEQGGAYKIIQIPTVNVNEVLKKYNLKNIDYISIDTEGSELEIIQAIDFKQFNIYALSIENNYKNPLIREWMSAQGFEFVAELQWDDIYYNPHYFNNLEPQEG